MELIHCRKRTHKGVREYMPDKHANEANTSSNTRESTYLSVLIILLALLISENVVNHPTTHWYNGL